MPDTKESEMSQLEFTVLRIVTPMCARIARLQASKSFHDIHEVTDCFWLLRNIETLQSVTDDIFCGSAVMRETILEQLFDYLDDVWESNNWGPPLEDEVHHY